MIPLVDGLLCGTSEIRIVYTCSLEDTLESVHLIVVDERARPAEAIAARQQACEQMRGRLASHIRDALRVQHLRKRAQTLVDDAALTLGYIKKYSKQ